MREQGTTGHPFPPKGARGKNMASLAGKVARLKNAHLTAKDVDDLVMETDREEAFARVFLHHLAICPECNAAGGFILEAFAAGEIDESLDRLSLDLFRSRLSAPTLWKEFEGWAPQERKRIVRK